MARSVAIDSVLVSILLLAFLAAVILHLALGTISPAIRIRVLFSSILTAGAAILDVTSRGGCARRMSFGTLDQ